MVCPCPVEYKTCCSILGLSKKKELSGRAVSSLTSDNIVLFAVKAGPGKIQCASATQLIIDSYRPDYVIDVGGAGALSSELKINDIVCVKNSFEYDVCDLTKFSQLSSHLATSTVLEKLLSSHAEIMGEFSTWVASNSPARLRFGDLASGERIINEEKLKKALHETLGAVACDWETSAVLKTAKLNNIRAFSFRVITDTAGKDMKKELKDNWEPALRILFSVLKEFLFHGWLHRVSGVLSSL